MPVGPLLAAPFASLATALLVAGAGAAVALGEGRSPDLLVSLRPDAPVHSSAVLAQAGGVLVAKDLNLWKLPARDAGRTLRMLRGSNSVASFEPEVTYASNLSLIPRSDPLLSQEWWRSAIGAEHMTPPGPGVPVSLIDSGIDLQHPEFVGRPNLTTLNSQEPQPFGGVHGTAVASVVGAEANGVGIVGVYPEAVIRSWDAATGLGTNLTSSAIVEGILAASKLGRTVINLSLGGPVPSAAIKAAVELAVRRGSLVVAASGNDGERGSPLNYPAALSHVLTVAATQPDGSVAPWSSRSRFVDLAAPGAQIPVATVDPETGAESWALENGTSFATPIVAGTAAWIWTVRPSLDAGQVAQILRSSATGIGVPGRDAASGFGLLNVPAALSLPAPIKDPAEPNDDVADVTPGRASPNGTTPLMPKAKKASRIQGRVDAAEDPRDIYRVWLPKAKQLSVRVSADSASSVTLVRASATSVAHGVTRSDLLANEAPTLAGARLEYRNPNPGRYVLLVVAPRTAKATTYTVSVIER
jgi:subtilisin family serine protease